MPSKLFFEILISILLGGVLNSISCVSLDLNYLMSNTSVNISNKTEYLIKTTWDNQLINDHEPISISFDTSFDAQQQQNENYLIINVKAKYFNEPAEPLGHKPGEFFNLWDYEVVEAFFLADSTGKYLELEFGPYGHYQVLLLDGSRNVVNKGLLLEYTSNIDRVNMTWSGQAKIPASYFPLKSNKLNAYAIHGTYNQRVYEALYPVPFQRYTYPDFHRLNYFQLIDFARLMPKNWSPDAKEDVSIWLKKDTA